MFKISKIMLKRNYVYDMQVINNNNN